MQARDKYKSWEDSNEKSFVVVTFQSSGGSQKIGTLEIDMGCPLELTREFLRRAFWSQLNEQTGAAFDFLQQGNVVTDESRARVRDVAPQRLNSVTRELENTLTICASMIKENIPLESQVWA